VTRTVEHIVETHQVAQARRDRGERVWQYQLVASMPADQPFEERRDHFAEVLHESKWFKDVAGDDTAELYVLWDEIKDAQDVEHFDSVLALIYDEADIDRCWITFNR
jgi:hypothetical protein